jgi:putative tryptophan/tyrosine transport system substrate-binding protein
MFDMRRREFIALIGGTAAAWPLAARAQQPAMPVIGLLSGRSLNDSKPMMAAFRQGLLEQGFVERQNVAIEYRWAEGHYDRLPAMAADLAGRQVAAILAVGSVPSPLAAKAATSTIPIVFVVGGDPVKFGLVSSLNRPGGNVTGVSVLSGALTAKRLELLRELVPDAGIVACLVNPKNPEAESQLMDIRAAGRTVRQKIIVLNASLDHELNDAMATIVRERASGLLVGNDAFFVLRREQLVELAARHAIPTIYFLREFAEAGGLVSYGDSLTDAYRQVGMYIGRILKGMKPADLPVVQSTKVELTINLKTAKALGLAVPHTLLARADEVIE